MSHPTDVTQRVIDAINAHDLSALRGLYAADARTRRPGWPQDADADYLLASYEMDFACVPDIRFEPLLSTTEGARIVTEVRITGTNTGPTVLGDFGKALLGRDVEAVPPTGRPIDLAGAVVHEVSEDKVIAERQYWGLLEFLVQIGVIGS
jgi:predicted ester cyclase